MEPSDLRGSGPWTIPATTPADVRDQLLDALAARGAADPGVARVAAAIAALARRGAPAGVARADAAYALAFAQGLPYRDDPGDVERYETVATTLAQGGTCHDLAPLLVALLRALGVPARVVWLTQEGRAWNHVSAQAYVDGAWRWAEATVRGARLGEDPYAAAARARAAPDAHLRADLAPAPAVRAGGFRLRR